MRWKTAFTLTVAGLALAAMNVVVPSPLRPSTASADAGIQVLSTAVENQFPKGLLFKVEATSPDQIKAIIVHFKVQGTRFFRYAYGEITAAPRVQTEILVRTDTSDRYIPPGVKMEYFFEIEDTANRRMETAPLVFTYYDPRFTWTEISEGPVTVLYYGPVLSRAQAILDTVVETIDRMGKVLSVTVTRPVRVPMYNNWRDMSSALLPRSRVQQSELITEGLTFGEPALVFVLGDATDFRGVASHEVVHFLINEAMGSYESLIPAWLNEGMAEYGNVVPSTTYEYYLSLALVRKTLKPLTSLDSMPGLSEDVIVVYGQGRSVVSYMIATYGQEKFREMLRRLREGNRMDRALELVYGFDRNGLDNRWRASIGAPLLDLSARTAPRPAPSVAPTVVPIGIAEVTPTATEPQPATKPSKEEPAPAAAGGCQRSDAPHVLDLSWWIGLGGLAVAFLLRRRQS